MRPVSVGYGEGTIDFNINRRKVIDGRAVVRLNPDGPCDRRVKVLRFDDGRGLAPLAVLMHAVCHPCVFTWGDKSSPPHPDGYPKMSADFPGEAQRFVEKVYGGRPRRCSSRAAPATSARTCPASRIAAATRPTSAGPAATSAARSCGRPTGPLIREELAKRPDDLPDPLRVDGRGAAGQGEAGARRVAGAEGRPVPVPDDARASRWSSTGSSSRRRSPTARCRSSSATPTASIGYICTAEAHKEGGYEPNMTPAGAGGRAEIIAESLRCLADRVIGDVFESFAPRLPVDRKNYTPSIPIETDKK